MEGYEPPKSIANPPDLLLEVYNEKSLYPFECPVFAIVGGGLPEKSAREVTTRVKEWLRQEWSDDRRGEPIMFEIIELVREFACEAAIILEKEEAARVQEEATARALRQSEQAKAIQQKIKEERRRVLAEAENAKSNAASGGEEGTTDGTAAAVATSKATTATSTRVKKGFKGKKLNIDPKFL